MPQDTTQTHEAVEWIRTKTDVGFRWLIENVGPRVKGMLVRKFGTCGEDTIETAIVEAAESLWLRGEPYDPERGSLVTWLYTAASRVCIDTLRAARVRPLVATLPAERMAEIYGGDGPMPRSARIARMLEDLRQCIARLSDREQEIILASLGEFDGTDNELGARLGTTANVVRVTRSRAHKKLAKWMRGMHGY